MTKESLLSISPIDGRYKNKVKDLENYFSEFALIKTRAVSYTHLTLPTIYSV